MRKVIKIVGLGDRRQGVSAKGREYDFTPVSFTYEMPWVNGYNAATCNINQDCMLDYTPAIGDEVEVVMREDYRTGSVYVDAIL